MVVSILYVPENQRNKISNNFHNRFMAASKVLGEETIAGSVQQQGQGQAHGQGNRTVERKEDSDSES